MRRTNAFIPSLLAAVMIAGCGGQSADQAATSTSDSLLAASPVEPPQGDLTPQTDYQQPEPEAPAPTPAPAKPASKPAPKPTPKPAPAPENPGVTIPAGTAIKIAVTPQISSETAQVGDTWEGTVAAPVVIGTAAPIPAGSRVTGVVSGVKPAEKGDRAFLLLSVRSIEVDGKALSIGATADSIIAGSTRARNLGAIAGGAAAGALIGKAVGGSGKAAAIGGLIGGAAAGAGVAASKGYQVVLKEGTELSFATNEVEIIK
jgi:hypothetical protein